VIGISGGELLKRPGPDVGCRAIEEEEDDYESQIINKVNLNISPTQTF
jgi:hypothetical protein